MSNDDENDHDNEENIVFGKKIRKIALKIQFKLKLKLLS